MAFSVQAFLNYAIPTAHQVLSPKDSILYALSVGYGRNPLEASHLRYVYERDLIAAPTLANVVAHPGPWMKHTGVDWTRLVHSEHRLIVHRPVPLDTPLFSRSRSLSVVDRGVGKGMFASFERVIFAQGDERPVASIIQTNAARGDGGCGSAGAPPEPLAPLPARAPDLVFSITVPEDAALLYRLNGDINALHVDPDEASRGGFPRPLLHGLCTFGYAGYALAAADASKGLAAIESIAARFSAPVFPGETVQFEIWREGAETRFRGRVPERCVTVLDNGTARLV